MASTLLIVDDEPSITTALSRVLQPDGYHVLTANSGAQALDLIRAQTVDVVLTDYRMPGMSGPALLEHVADTQPNTTRLMLSGADDLHAVIEAMNSGAIQQSKWSKQGFEH